MAAMIATSAFSPVPSFVPAPVRKVAAALFPFLVLLVLTALVRLPFVALSDEDEFFYTLVGARWLDGLAPYTHSFDIKPPGIYAIFAAVESVFGHSMAMIKGLEMVFTALGAFALYRILGRHVSRPAALWAAGLYPVYTLTLSGVSAVNMLIQLPFFILAFEAALTALSRQDNVMRAVFWSGLWVGLAGMVKQTALFEAVAIFVLLLVYIPRRLWLPMTAALGLGAALPAIGFGLYFWATGHFKDMFEAVILSALARTSPDVMAGYGEKYRFYVTPLGATINAILLSVSLIVLWGAALLAALRRKRLKAIVPDAVMSAAGLWLLAALIEAVAGRALCEYYMLSFVPPLLVLTAITIVHGLDIAGANRRRAWPVIALFAVAMPLIIERDTLFTLKFQMTDYAGTQAVARELKSLGFKPRDSLLVLNRGYNIYLETDARPPTRYIHSVHMMTTFHTPSSDALGENLAARPRFIVVANPSRRVLDESDAKYQQAFAVIGAQYAQVGQVSGKLDSFRIYRRLNGS